MAFSEDKIKIKSTEDRFQHQVKSKTQKLTQQTSFTSTVLKLRLDFELGSSFIFSSGEKLTPLTTFLF